MGCLLWDKRKGRPVVLKACALFCSAAIALVLLTMYNIDPRHMMLLAILLLGAIVVEDAAPAGGLAADSGRPAAAHEL